MQDERDEIRARIDLVDLVGQKVLLKRAGKHWKGLCPFHDDRNPSFYVSPDTGRYKCWSCGEGGDAFTWVMKTQNMEFVEALKTLADMAGVTLSSYKPEKESGRAQKLAMMRAAQAFFVESIGKNSMALDYCHNRGLDDATIAEWGIGYSPADDHALATRLRKDKFALAEAKELFLVEIDGSGAYFDKFRGRIMFPIHDERGELVAFGGRALGDAQPKYINSSDTPLFHKSRLLYGLHRAKDAITKSRRAVLVEGYLDVIACHRSGVTTAVASLGTSLAEEHAKLLRRWCDEALILYDADAAGEKAANRACEIMQAEGLVVRVALMPKGQDPDTLLREAGTSAVQAAVKAGLTPTEFQILQLERKVDPQSEEFWNSIVDALAGASSLSEVEKHFAYLRGKYLHGRGMVEEQLRHRVRESQRAKLKHRRPLIEPAKQAIVMETCLPAESVILRAFLENDLRFQAHQAIARGMLVTSRAKDVGQAILNAFPDSPPKGRPIEWLSKIEPQDAQEFLADSLLRAASDSDLVKRRLGEVSHGEMADALHLLQTLKERQEVEVIKTGELSTEDAAMAVERLKAKHEREAARWEN